MPTNLAIDDKLLERARRMGGQRTKRATVNQALEEFIRRRLRMRAIQAFGTIEFDHRYDHKAARRKR